MSPAAPAWTSALMVFADVFTRPSFLLFQELVTAWVLCPGRRTVTGMISILVPAPRRAHDAYHRFLRAGAWSLSELWKRLVVELVQRFCPHEQLFLDLDDTLFHRTGPQVDGAGIFRDPIRSTAGSVVYALGLNLVVLTLRVRPPWGGESLALPIGMRVYRKGGPTHLDLAEQMIRQLAEWLPVRSFLIAGDGAWASLAGRSLPRTHITSRMRRDAALYRLPPPRRKGQRGRPRKRGKRLPCPEEMARRWQRGWQLSTIECRGRTLQRLLLHLPVLWYAVCPDQTVLLVIVRDPGGKEPDDFFFTTDLDALPADVAAQYAGRWSIEETFRNVKQVLRGEDPQSWKGQGPERAAALSLWLYSMIWLWYISQYGSKPHWRSSPWYRAKQHPSFADAVAALRQVLWREMIFGRCNHGLLPDKIIDTLLDALSHAA